MTMLACLQVTNVEVVEVGGAPDPALPFAIVGVWVLVLAIFVGVEVISKVPATLHTPLMSGANAISGITLVGALLLTGSRYGWLGEALAFVAIVLATVNIVGGFLVTDRMLTMFRARPAAKRERS